MLSDILATVPFVFSEESQLCAVNHLPEMKVHYTEMLKILGTYR